jgi:type IV secretory pathway VirB2 component (pilin)
MHDVAVLGVIAQGILYNFAEGFWKKALVQLGDGLVYVFFGCGNSALQVALVHGEGRFWLFKGNQLEN